jgi:NAD(P)-dependent dehydrogenase (short-subunit alcohol dehydrogenase family)
MGRLENRTAVVTGGGTGIGLEIARRFSAEGAAVVICGRSEAKLRAAVSQISARPDAVLCVTADVGKETDVAALMQRAVRWKGRLDILVNNAAAMRINKAPEDTTLAEWKSVIDPNINGAFLCCREAGRIMIGQRYGRIVNISSMSASVVNRYFHGGSYEVSKAALSMLTRVLAVEWAPHNITVNAIAPGYHDTQPNRDFFATEKGLAEKVLELIPAGRLGSLEELSNLVLLLASDMVTYMTGSVLPIDGGYTLW